AAVRRGTTSRRERSGGGRSARSGTAGRCPLNGERRCPACRGRKAGDANHLPPRQRGRCVAEGGGACVAPLSARRLPGRGMATDGRRDAAPPRTARGREAPPRMGATACTTRTVDLG